MFCKFKSVVVFFKILNSVILSHAFQGQINLRILWEQDLSAHKATIWTQFTLIKVVSESVMKRLDYIFPKYHVKAAESWFGFRNSACKIFKLSSEMKIVKQEGKRSRKDHQTFLETVAILWIIFQAYSSTDIETGYNFSPRRISFQRDFSKERRHLQWNPAITKCHGTEKNVRYSGVL